MAWVLLPQFVALVLGAVAVACGAGRWRGAAKRPRALAGATSLAVVAAIVGAAGAGERLLSAREDVRAATPAERATRGGTEAGADVDFVEWVRGRIPSGATYDMVYDGARDEATYQWMAYRLYPSRLAARTDADWLVFDGADPRAAHDRGTFEVVDTFARRRAIARVIR